MYRNHLKLNWAKSFAQFFYLPTGSSLYYNIVSVIDITVGGEVWPSEGGMYMEQLITILVFVFLILSVTKKD